MEGPTGLRSYAEHRMPQHQFDLISIAGEESDANPRSVLSWVAFPPEGVLSAVKSLEDGSGINSDDYIVAGPALDQAALGPSSPDSQEPDDDRLADDGMVQLRYSFRPGARQQHDGHQFFFHDQDDTGNYDTDEERRQSRIQRKRKARAYPVQQNDYNAELEGESQAKRPRVQERLIFTIKLTREDVLQRARTYFQAIDRARQEELEVWQRGDYLLRRRHSDKEGLNDSIQSDLQGHPAGRGCTECVTLGLVCSVLDNEFEWPCASCKQENTECMPAVPPARKAACSNCIAFGASKRTRWLICSNLYDENQGDCCRECEKTGSSSTCVAHPDLSEVHQRVRIVEGSPYVNDRPATLPVRASCLQCQAANRNCSFDGKSDITEACVGCQMGGLTCQPVTTDKTAWMDVGRTQHPRTHALLEPSPERTAEEVEHGLGVSKAVVPPLEIIEISDDSDGENRKPKASKPIPIIGRKGVKDLDPRDLSIMKVFRTKLCHPVVFNHDDFEDNTRSCSFCEHPACAVIGNTMTKVLGRKLRNGKGWEELKAEPVRGDLKNTVLCIPCTAHRLNIMQCPTHDMEPLDQAPTRVQDAWERLKSGFWDRWCSICCSIATHACCSESVGNGTLSLRSEKGCGLLTCDACTIGLQTWDGDLQKMLFSIEDIKSEKRPEGLRADWCLLKQGEILDNFVKNQ